MSPHEDKDLIAMIIKAKEDKTLPLQPLADYVKEKEYKYNDLRGTELIDAVVCTWPTQRYLWTEIYESLLNLGAFE